MLAKGFLTDNLGHTFLIDTRMEPLSAQKKKKNLENHNLTGGLVFKFPVLFTALLEFIQKMLLNIFYQSWQRQTMLCNNSCQSLGCVYADLYSGYRLARY